MNDNARSEGINVTLQPSVVDWQAANAARERLVLIECVLGLLGWLVLFALCRRHFRRAPANSLRARLAGVLSDPVGMAESSFQQTLANARLARPASPPPAPPQPAPARPSLLELARHHPDWLVRCETSLEILARLPTEAPEHEELVRQVRRDLAPSPAHPPDDLATRARISQRCRRLWPKEGWPLLYELASRYWRGDELGAKKTMASLSPAQLKGVSDAALLIPVSFLLLDARRYPDAAAVMQRMRDAKEFGLITQPVISWASAAGKHEAAAPPIPAHWRDDLQALQQRVSNLDTFANQDAT